MSVKSTKQSLLIPLASVGILLAITVVILNSIGVNSASGGFDNYGYNYKANIFQGKADGVDRNIDGTVWGDTTYASDFLVMKWSKAWDNARFEGQPWTCDAWTDNEWNGKGQNGSGEVWHYKISWVGPELQKSTCWREGGYPIWGQFEVTFSQGSIVNKHFWDARSDRPGYGVY